ncbi:protein cornichon homolog 4 [Leptidea sinapis]|uniref:protein cornichon homolog 4 n=1 Tax=Leptidea sinapis TaxID=189913 RepID=UPI0021C4364F|nr:protein cornichon homolog 4 [Leptidea sinapis]
MIFDEYILFSFALLGSGAIFFLLIYYIMTLSDLECDYLNAQECCEKLNYWFQPKFICHFFITFLLLIHGQILLFLFNLPMCVWLAFQYFTIPQGNLGAYDPTEIHNRGHFKRYMRDVLINIGFYLIFFFIYLYFFILSLLKGDPIQRGSEFEIVTRI